MSDPLERRLAADAPPHPDSRQDSGDRAAAAEGDWSSLLRLAEVMDSLPAMISYWDRDLRCHYANRRYFEWFGRRAEDLSVLTPSELLGSETFRANEPYMREALAGRKQEVHRTVTAPAGGSRHIWAQYIPDRVAGDIVGVHVLVVDITPIKEAEEARLRSERRFRALIDNTPIPFAVVDEPGNIVYINAAFTGTFGYTLEDLPTRDDWWRKAYPSPSYQHWVRSLWEQHLLQAARRGEPFEPLEVSIHCKDGSQRTALSLTVDLDGEFKGNHLGVLIDVTEQRQLERNALERSTRERSQLGMDIHDGLGQELTGLSLFVKALSNRLTTASREDIARDLAEIEANILSTLNSVRALGHGLAPIEHGLQGFESALQRLARSTMAAGGPALTLAVRGYEHAIGVDDGLLEQLFRVTQEAVANAAKHGRATQIQILVEVRPGVIELTVHDNGRGIEPGPVTGGLGLKLMRHRVRTLGGRLKIDSSRATGTLIQVRLPLDASMSQAERNRQLKSS